MGGSCIVSTASMSGKYTKSIISLFCVVLFLTGCTGNTDVSDVVGDQQLSCTLELPVTLDVAETVELTEKSTFETVDTSVTSEENKHSPLDVLVAGGQWYVTAEIDEGDIEAQLGYDTPVDVTKLEEFPDTLAYLEEMDQQERKRITAQNYSYIIFLSCYVGTENADWLYGATYYLTTSGAPAVPYYSKLFYVKDGVITDTVAEFDCSIGMMSYWGTAVIVPTDTAIYSLERGSTELVKLADTQYWSRLLSVEDDYIIFYDHGQTLKIYYRDSGEIFTTDIHRGLHDAFSFIVLDDVLYFCDYMGTQKYRSFDIYAREYVDNDIDTEEMDRIFDEYYAVRNELYSVDINSRAAKISVTSHTTGEEKWYTLKLPSIEYVNDIALDGSTLYLKTDGCQFFAVNVAEDTAVILECDNQKYGHTSFYYDDLTDTVYLASQTNETAAAIKWNE